MCVNVKTGKVVSVPKRHALKTYGGGGSGYIVPRIFNLGTRWRWVVNFTPRMLYPGERAPPVPIG